LEELAAESDGRYIVAKLNTDDNPRVAGQFRINAIPTLLIFKNGRLVDQLVGLQPKPAILARLEQMVPEPPLFPPDKADAVREAERWGDEELQDLGRRMPWGALHFRPEALGTFGGAGMLDPAGTDFAIRTLRAAWKYHKITAQRLYDDLQGLPAKLDHVEALIADGVVGGEQPNAADLQIAATLAVLRCVRDLAPLLRDSPAERLAEQWFPGRQGEIPPGAFPSGWVPAGR